MTMRRNNSEVVASSDGMLLFLGTTNHLQTRVPRDESSSNRFLIGYILAGVASCLLTTIFGLFHVDVFLRIHQLPLSSYATGNLVFSVINTANDLGGAWIVDSLAAQHIPKSRLVGLSGILFGLCFTTPFFPWHLQIGTFWHFVLSLSLYDTMYSFVTILLGSIVTDSHDMSERDRVRILATGKVVNMLASFGVARIGLAAMLDCVDKEEASTGRFRVFVLILALIVSILFCMAQYLMTNKRNEKGGVLFSWRAMLMCCGGQKEWSTLSREHQHASSQGEKPRLQLRRVARIFWNHKNFRAWIGMEMLLECQFNFLTSFTKTLVDRLVFGKQQHGWWGSLVWTRQNCDWFLSVLRPATQVTSILAYLPVRKLGYKRLYTAMFATNLVLSGICLCLGSPDSTCLIVVFLTIYTIITGAVSSAGFHLAMSDMVLEAKVQHPTDPSLAGLFMGANALMCKPMDSLLPIVAAHFLKTTNFQQRRQVVDDLSSAANSATTTSEWVLFRFLVMPPLLFSILQLASWSQYKRPKRIKNDLQNELKQFELLHEEDGD